MKMCEMNYLVLFCKSYLVLFLTFIIGTPILCCTRGATNSSFRGGAIFINFHYVIVHIQPW